MGTCSVGAYSVISWFDQQLSTAREPSTPGAMLPPLTRQAHHGVICMVLLEAADLNLSLVYPPVKLIHTIVTSILITHGFS